MADTFTANLFLVNMVTGQASAEVKYNTAINILDAMVSLRIIDSSPPVAPPEFAANGAAYVVPASATGDWSTFAAGSLAVYYNGWVEIPSKRGMRGRDLRSQKDITWHVSGGMPVDIQQAAEAVIPAFVEPSSFAECDANDGTTSAKVNNLIAKLITAGILGPASALTEVVNEAVAVNETNVKIVTAV